MTLSLLVFDLDGTLSASGPGILAALRYALDAHGLPPLDAATERTILGPPFYESLPPLVGDANVWPVIETYRARYATTMFDTAGYDGIDEVLAATAAAGIPMAVATSKVETHAERIVEHLGLRHHFATVAGDEPDGSLRTKALVIGKVFDRLGRPDPAEVLMVGDRSHDVLGAHAHGVSCIGAGWGYGAPGELEAAGAALVCAEPRDLLPVVADGGLPAVVPPPSAPRRQ